MLRTRIVPTPPNITHLVWEDYTGYRQYNVKCGCTTSMGTACRRWCVGYRDGVTPVCMTHISPNATPTLSPAAIERRREVAAARRAIRLTAILSEIVARYGDPGFTEVTEVVETTDECPICLESYELTRKAVCGHHACSECCSSMKASGRTICCPLCRDKRFVGLVNVNHAAAPVTV